MANSCPTENGRMNNLAGASIAVFRSVLGGAAGLMGSAGLAGNAGLPTSIQALPRVAEAVAPAAVAVISELPLPWQK
jgi:hypothetical protein